MAATNSSGGGPAIVARDLTKTYGKDVRALQGLSLSVDRGTIFGMLGPNGAGKSTTVKILTTLSRPDSGTATVEGIDVLAQPQQVRRVTGTVGQKSAVDPSATGRENLQLQGRFYGLGGSELRKRIDAQLARFGLTEAGKRLVGTYSGGMQRKLDVAMGLIHSPRVLFLDEPTTGLDPEARAELWSEIRRLASQEGLTILLTTHYLEEADQLCARLAIVDGGRVVAEGSPDQLKSELHGDAIVAELRDPDQGQRALAAVDRVDGLREASVDGRSIRARADRGAAAVPSLIAALDAADVAIAAVTVARPSLDDVYLRHTGRSYAANEESYR
jgi:ABC-2 type transport system ATP-binding protein